MSINVNPYIFLTLPSKIYRALRGPVRHSESLCDQTLGFAQTHWGTLPQTPFIELPTPQSLRDSLAGGRRSTGTVLTTTRGTGSCGSSIPYARLSGGRYHFGHMT
ncbi:hypothetical protein CW304_30010 [Bacillus sp. UFRGS-B20]|nr:hypothetical protein CW304_30010 [Bacillus sp. UFRGS-B20]